MSLSGALQLVLLTKENMEFVSQVDEDTDDILFFFPKLFIINFRKLIIIVWCYKNN